MPFQIDGADVKDPISWAYEEVYTPFENSHGYAVVSAYRSAVATFNVMTPAQFEDWVNAYDGDPHSIQCYAPDSTSFDTYTNVYIESLNTEISNGLYYYNASFRVWHISTADLPAFGATEVPDASSEDASRNDLFNFPHAVLGLGLAVHTPSTVWEGTMSKPAFPSDGTGVGQLTVTATTSGSFANVREGMLVELNTTTSTTTAGRYYTYARKAPIAGTIYIDGFSDGTLSTGAWGSPNFKVYNTYIPYPRRIRYNSGTWYMNFDEAYTNQNTNIGPLAIMGTTAIKYVDGSVTFDFDGSDSVAYTAGSTIATYAWEFPDSTTAATAVATWTTSTAYPDGAWVHLTVTDSNGDTHTGHRLLFKFDSSNPPKTDFSIESLTGEWGGGARASLLSADVNLTSTGYDNPLTHVTLFGDTAYGGTPENILIDSEPQRMNVWLDGYVLSTALEIHGGYDLYRYELGTIDALLDTIDAFPLTMDDDAAASTWLEMTPLTLNNILIHFIKWRSTISLLTDIFTPPIEVAAGDSDKKYQDLQSSTLWQQLKQIYGWIIGGEVSADCHNRIFCEQDIMINGESAQNYIKFGDNTTTGTLLQAGYTFGNTPSQYVRRNSQFTAYGVDYATPAGSRAPDDPIAHGASREMIQAGIHGSQTEINIWAGRMRAKLNNSQTERVYPTVGVVRIDCVPQHSVAMFTQGEAQVPIIRHVIRSYSWEFDMENGMAWATYELERLLDNPDNRSAGGTTITFTTI